VPQLIRLRLDRFLQGNIILQVSIREGDQCQPESIKRVWGDDYNDDDAELQRHLPDWAKEIRDNNWTLVEISTSYGCELFALSRSRVNEIMFSEGFGSSESPR
jgi:hypothetical protein